MIRDIPKSARYSVTMENLPLRNSSPALRKIAEQARWAAWTAKNSVQQIFRQELAPLIEKRRYYEMHMELVKEILLEGEAKAKVIACHTMQEVRTAMKLGETTCCNNL